MLDSPASTPEGRPEHRRWRIAAGVLLLADAAIHACEALSAGLPFLVGGFTATAAGTMAAACLLLTRAPRLGWIAGGLTTLLTFAGYVLTRSMPVPGDRTDVGNWLEPPGVASLVIEAVVVAAAVWALTGGHPVRLRHLVQEAKAVTPGLCADSVHNPVAPESGPDHVPAGTGLRQSR